MRVALTSYVGNGTSQSITGVGFQSDVVIVVGGSERTVWTLASGQPDRTLNFGQDSSSGEASFTGGITSIDSDGFSVGSDDRVNKSGNTFYACCMARTATTNFWEGTYAGDGTDDRDITSPGFQPTIGHIKARNGSVVVNMRGIWKVESLADPYSAEYVNGSGLLSSGIKDFVSSGFRLGTNHRVNRSGSTYWAYMIKSESGYIAEGSYVGDGLGEREITVGFTPAVVFTHTGVVSDNGNLRFSNFPSNQSLNGISGGGGFVTNAIRDFTASGFKTMLNSSGVTYYWWAWGSGFLPPVAGVGYPRRIRAHPTESSKVIAEGVSTTGDAGLIFVSEDGGLTWTRKGRGGNNLSGLSLAVNYINPDGHLITGITDTGNAIKWLRSVDHGDTWDTILSYTDSGSRALDVAAHGNLIFLLSDKRLYQINDDHAIGTPLLIADCNAGGSGPEAGSGVEYQSIKFDSDSGYLYLLVKISNASGKVYKKNVLAGGLWIDITEDMNTDLGYIAVGHKLGLDLAKVV